MFSLQHRAVRALTFTATLLHTHALSVPTSTGVKLLFEPPAKRVARKHVLLGTKDSLLSNGAKDLLPEGLPFLRWKYLVELADADAGTEGASANWMFTAADGKPKVQSSRHSSAECSHAGAGTSARRLQASQTADKIGRRRCRPRRFVFCGRHGLRDWTRLSDV